MKIAFCLFKYFPFGGLQRDFMRIAKACQQRGHDLTVFCQRWDADTENWLNIKQLPAGFGSHAKRATLFAKALQQQLQQQQFDRIVGFNKLPGLDVYFAADTCFRAFAYRERSCLYRCLPRYQRYVHLEQTVFSGDVNTLILTLNKKQQNEYQQCYDLPAHRFYLLPPGLNPGWQRPVDAMDIRQRMRQELGLDSASQLFLAVGSQFKTKGLARSLKAFASLDKYSLSMCKFLVIGDGDVQCYQNLAKNLGLANHVKFIPAQANLIPYFLAADLLLHPSLRESAGMVIIEALAMGLPQIVTATCGYAEHVVQSRAGYVLSEPFQQSEFDIVLADIVKKSPLTDWQQRALDYVSRVNLSGMVEAATEIICQH